MDYLDYLTEREYHELPASVRGQITESDYREQRAVALRLRSGAGTPALPPALRAAYRARVRPTAAGGSRRFRSAAAAAAAGWLLAVVLAGVLYLRPSTTAPAAPPPVAAAQPTVITRVDTVRQFVDRPVYRIRFDTIYRTLPAPATRIVVVHDTLYLPPPSPESIQGSHSLAGEEGLFKAIYGAGE